MENRDPSPADGRPPTACGDLEQRLEAAQRRVRVLLDGQADAFFVVDGERFTDVNRVACERLGYSREELLSMGPVDLDIPENAEARARAAEVMEREGQATFEVVHRARDGRLIPTEISSRYAELGGRRVTLAVARDVSARKSMEADLARTRRRLELAFEHGSDGLWDWDLRSGEIYYSPRWATMLGYAPEEIGTGLEAWERLVHPADHLATMAHVQEVLEGDLPAISTEFRMRAKSGEWRWILARGMVVERDGGGRPLRLLGTNVDLTEQKRLQEDLLRTRGELEQRVAERTAELEETNDRLRLEIAKGLQAQLELKLASEVFEHTQEGILITDAMGNILKVNPAFTAITGYGEEDVLGRNPSLLKSDRHPAEFYQELWRSLRERGQWEGEIWNRRKNGEAYPEWLSIAALRGPGGRITHYVAVFHDITESKRSQERIAHQAQHDALTDLPNRVLFLDRLGVALSHARRDGLLLAVLFLDLDNFKQVNDTLGHAAGDSLLRQVAGRLMELVRGSDSVARLGGDEFVVLLESLPDESEAVLVAERILASFREPFPLRGEEVFVTPSLGLTFFPEDGEDPETLIKNADLAMYRAKETGRNTLELFTPAMNARVAERRSLERDLRRAVERGDFAVHFQPIAEAADGRTVALEALVRWPGPDGLLRQPSDFLDLAEETGLILPLGRFVLERSCALAGDLRARGLPDLQVAVNLSARQFLQQDPLEFLGEALEGRGLEPGRLRLELNEATLMGEPDRSERLLHRLVDAGYSVSVDDFGTGFSSLFCLQRFPLSALKIDCRFVRGLARDGGDAAMVQTILQMARNLGLKAVAEGVETEAQLRFLTERGGPDLEFQGYLLTPPLPAESLLSWLGEREGL